MFYPIRNELELCETASGTYMEKLLDPNVQGVVNENKLKFEPFADLVDTALLNFHSDSIHNPDSFSQEENDEGGGYTQRQAFFE